MGAQTVDGRTFERGLERSKQTPKHPNEITWLFIGVLVLMKRLSYAPNFSLPKEKSSRFFKKYPCSNNLEEEPVCESRGHRLLMWLLPEEPLYCLGKRAGTSAADRSPSRSTWLWGNGLSAAHGILAPQPWMEPASHALEDTDLITGPPGKSQQYRFDIFKVRSCSTCSDFPVGSAVQLKFISAVENLECIEKQTLQLPEGTPRVFPVLMVDPVFVTCSLKSFGKQRFLNNALGVGGNQDQSFLAPNQKVPTNISNCAVTGPYHRWTCFIRALP
ncbi:hypothetical protein MJT46_012229 [Ovis ammon polii x Ovis aries]|nr:hypothetical protein MJT46_012229 [Ovis ammon polii x Ovis aries]